LPKLPRLPAREIIRAVERTGLRRIRQRGSHVILTDPLTGRTVVVPDYGSREVPIGTLKGILRQARLTVGEFIDLLE